MERLTAMTSKLFILVQCGVVAISSIILLGFPEGEIKQKGAFLILRRNSIIKKAYSIAWVYINNNKTYRTGY